MTLFRAFKNRAFALLWFGQTLSRIGDFIYEISLAWWVLQKTGSPETMSLVLVFSVTPSVIFLLVGGAVVDRLPRLLLMLFSDIGCAAVALVVSALAFTDQLLVWHVYVASLFFGFATAFFEPAYAAIIPQIVPEDDLGSANALTSISVNAGRVAGPALGAGLVAAFGSAPAFALNGASFAISALVILPLLRMGIPRPPASEHTNLLADIRAGFQLVLSTPWLWISILVFSLVNVTLSGPYSVAMPFLVEQDMQAGVERLGLIYAFFPAGFIIAAAWLGRFPRLPRRGMVMFAGLMLGAVMLMLYGFGLPLWLLLIAALVNGFALQAGMLAWTHLLQEKIPNEQLGRVSSIDQTGSFILMPVGLIVAGWATTALGPSTVFIIGGAVTALAGLAALLHPAIRGLD